MKKYRIDHGIGRLGAGEIVGLDADQLRTRRHNVEVLQTFPDFATCRPNVPLEFKAGEVIRLPYDPPKFMSEIIVPMPDEGGKEVDASEVTPAAPSPERPATPKGKGKVRRA